MRRPVWAVLGPLYELQGAHVRRRRSFGCDAPIGLIYSINPFMIVLFVPLVGALTTGALGGSSAQRCAAARLAYHGHTARLPAELQSSTAPAGRPSRAAGYSPTRAGYQHFDMIHLGGYISALSPFWMVAFTSGARWLCLQCHRGQPCAALLAARLGSASLRMQREVLGCAACASMVFQAQLLLAEWATAAFVATLSLGEAVWSPRWYDYSMVRPTAAGWISTEPAEHLRAVAAETDVPPGIVSPGRRCFL